MHLYAYLPDNILTTFFYFNKAISEYPVDWFDGFLVLLCRIWLFSMHNVRSKNHKMALRNKQNFVSSIYFSMCFNINDICLVTRIYILRVVAVLWDWAVLRSVNLKSWEGRDDACFLRSVSFLLHRRPLSLIDRTCARRMLTFTHIPLAYAPSPHNQSLFPPIDSYMSASSHHPQSICTFFWLLSRPLSIIATFAPHFAALKWRGFSQKHGMVNRHTRASHDLVEISKQFEVTALGTFGWSHDWSRDIRVTAF